MTLKLFYSLGDTLLRYKNATAIERQAMLVDSCMEVNNLSRDVKDIEKALDCFKTLALAQALFHYANVLNKMEQQDFFDIPESFYNMPMEGRFTSLHNYFQFLDSRAEMKLKQPLAQMQPWVWLLFNEALSAHVNNASEFDLELSTLPSSQQLYPIPIKMHKKQVQELVVFIQVNSDGEYRIYNDFNTTELPHVQPLNPNDRQQLESFLRQMLIRFVSEEQANIVTTAANEFNAIDSDKFQRALNTVWASVENNKLAPVCKTRIDKIIRQSKNEKAVRLQNILSAIDEYIQTEEAIYAKLEEQVRILSNNIISCNTSGQNANEHEPAFDSAQTALDQSAQRIELLENLRSTFIINTFILTNLFARAMDYVTKNVQQVDIPQFFTPGYFNSAQVMHAFLLIGQPLDEWFLEQLNGQPGVRSKHLTRHYIYKTMPEILAAVPLINPSHVLVMWAHLDANSQNLENTAIWNEQLFNEACSHFQIQVLALLDKNRKLIWAQADEMIKNMIAKLSPDKQSKIFAALTALSEGLAHSESVAECANLFRNFQHQCAQVLVGPQYTLLHKTLITLAAIALASSLIAAAGFGMGFYAGLWAGPGSFINAVMANNPAGLAVLCATTAAGLFAGCVSVYGFFAAKTDTPEMVVVKEYASDLQRLKEFDHDSYTPNFVDL